jgi:hypothetical protein
MRWLERQPSLEELQKAYPKEWAATEDDLAEAIRDKSHSKLNGLLQPRIPSLSAGGHRRAALTKREAQDLSSRLIRQRMAALAIERYLKTSLTDGKDQSLPAADRLIFRCLFFDKDYKRKLVSDFAYRLL